MEKKYQELSPFQRFTVGVPLRMARWVIHHPYAAGTATLLFSSVIVFALITLFRPPQNRPEDLNPTHVKFAGELMIILNQWGDTLDTELVGAKYAQGQESDNATGNPRLIRFYDVDGDGIDEIIWGQTGWEKSGFYAVVYCKSIKEDRLLWADTLSKKLHFSNISVEEEKFTCFKILVGDFDADGQAEVITVAKHDFFPTLIRKTDGIDGSIVSEYINIGGVEDIVAKDLDGDGRSEIIVCGINNAYKMASLFVLDPRMITGHSPLTERYELQDIESGREIFYLLIPKTRVGESGTTSTGWNKAASISSFNDNRKIFRVCMADLIAEGEAGYSIYFDYDFVPRNYETGDLFDLVAKRFYEGKKIPSLPDSAFWADYSKKIGYWDGDEWQQKPVRNKYYSRAFPR